MNAWPEFTLHEPTDREEVLSIQFNFNRTNLNLLVATSPLYRDA